MRTFLCLYLLTTHCSRIGRGLLLLLIALCLSEVSPQALGQAKLGKGSALAFASLEQGRGVLTSRDEFVERMSPFDRAARMKTDRDVSEREYLEFAGSNALEWTDEEKQKIGSAFATIQAKLAALQLPLPETVLLVKTTGREEGGAAYTRANAIVLPQGNLKNSIADLSAKLAHELFHVLSRANPAVREKLYAAIGFAPCAEVAFPAELRARKITNPDAPKNNHCIRLKAGNEECWAIPILYSNTEKYDIQRGGEFFNYMQFRLLIVDRAADSKVVTPRVEGGITRLMDVQAVSGFFEQVGKNTGYIIHPEEILADNFMLIVLGKRDAPTPTVIQNIEAALQVQ
jgi:hypothetical protein